MFRNVFSFKGRIRRREFALSILIYILAMFIVQTMVAGFSSNSISLLELILFIPCLWFYMAQRAKRCHDLGSSGWYQLIPFYGFWMFFADGMPFPNEYGDPPKPINEYPDADPEQNPEPDKEDQYISEEDEKNLRDEEGFHPLS